MKKDFELISYTADIGIQARGMDFAQAFENAARGMFSLVTGPEKINETVYRDIAVNAPDREALLVEWLNELIYLFDTEMLLFKRFHIANWQEDSLRARCYGEKIDKSRHEIKRGIKAATYHKLKVEKLADGVCQVEVLLDI